MASNPSNGTIIDLTDVGGPRVLNPISSVLDDARRLAERVDEGSFDAVWDEFVNWDEAKPEPLSSPTEITELTNLPTTEIASECRNNHQDVLEEEADGNQYLGFTEQDQNTNQSMMDIEVYTHHFQNEQLSTEQHGRSPLVPTQTQEFTVATQNEPSASTYRMELLRHREQMSPEELSRIRGSFYEPIDVAATLATAPAALVEGVLQQMAIDWPEFAADDMDCDSFLSPAALDDGHQELETADSDEQEFSDDSLFDGDISEKDEAPQIENELPLPDPQAEGPLYHNYTSSLATNPCDVIGLPERSSNLPPVQLHNRENQYTTPSASSSTLNHGSIPQPSCPSTTPFPLEPSYAVPEQPSHPPPQPAFPLSQYYSLFQPADLLPQQAYSTSQTLGTDPEPSYTPAEPTYTLPEPSSTIPELSFAPPEPSYTPAETSYTPPEPLYTPPEPLYAPIEPSYAPPEPLYAPPELSYAPPELSYAPPEPSYAPPNASYAPLEPSYTPTEPSYYVPPETSYYTPPEPSYIPPEPSFDLLEPQHTLPDPPYTLPEPPYSISHPSQAISEPYTFPQPSAVIPESPYTPCEPAYDQAPEFVVSVSQPLGTLNHPSFVPQGPSDPMHGPVHRFAGPSYTLPEPSNTHYQPPYTIPQHPHPVPQPHPYIHTESENYEFNAHPIQKALHPDAPLPSFFPSTAPTLPQSTPVIPEFVEGTSGASAPLTAVNATGISSRHPVPYKFEDGKFVCIYTGPASQNREVECGQTSSSRDNRARNRHLATHAAKEENLIAEGKISREDAVALDWVCKIVVSCEKPGCGFEIAVWRTDNVRKEHYLNCHPGDPLPKCRPRIRPIAVSIPQTIGPQYPQPPFYGGVVGGFGTGQM